MTTHVKVVAVLFIILGVVGVIGALFSSALFGALTLAGLPHGGAGFPISSLVLGLTGLAFTAWLLLLSIPSIVCGWGLLKMRRWARLVGIILAVLTVFRFPLGTVVGVYALWVLLQRDTEALFASPVGSLPRP
jgi:hypothetical protein